nr:carnitine O-acetyltransferase-like isoform X1 [Onthophagus taurus]
MLHLESPYCDTKMYGRAIASTNKILRPKLLNLTRAETSILPSFLNARNVSQNLPRLPVPALKQTLDKFLLTAKPHLSDKEFASTTELIKKFSDENGIGAKLQKYLVEKAKSTENWLSEWWLHSAYLDFRYPVIIHSSPALVYPIENFKTEHERLVYSARLILAVMEYKLLIDNDKIPTDMMGKDPLDMNQYKQVIGTCRIPGLKRDKLEYYPTSKHVVVMHNNHFFKVHLFGDNNQLISENQLLQQLHDIMEQSVATAPPIGILTSDSRDNWGKAYQQLIKDPENEASAKEIQKSLFLVCLDGPMSPLPNENRKTIAGRQLLHGGGSKQNGGNRWYDKTIQFIIGQDGLVGLNYEHSPSEGQPVAVISDYIYESIKKESAKGKPDVPYNKIPERLPFNVNDEIQKAILVASKNVDEQADGLDLFCLHFDSFGKDFIKSQKLSPDSFIQIALQYAFYRVHKTPGAHYESAATRKYAHGRTETIRSCSIESIDFAKTMLDNTKSNADKVTALKKAIDGHKKYTVEAMNGFGVDRHLLGLKLAAMELGEKIPEIYSDPGYVRSAHMRISTSQVATKCDGFMCFGPLVPDGYACCYNPRPKDINFGISAFTAHPDTSAVKFKDALVNSLNDMHDILAKTQKSKM